MSVLNDANRLGQGIWLDNLSRTLLEEGGLAALIARGLAGVTSNPSIFLNSITHSPYYAGDLKKLKSTSIPLEGRFEALAVPDIQAACDLFLPVYSASQGEDGYVSLEVSPNLAHDEKGTIASARRLSALVSRKNLLIKIPATSAGVKAIEQLISEGISINVTLMFSLEHVFIVAQAYINGLQRRLAAGQDITHIKSVSSLFLSRVDTLVDKRLETLNTDVCLSLRGQAAVSMAKLAYQRYLEIFNGSGFTRLREAGAKPQYLLWASTGTKNPSYSPLLYVEPLIGPQTINTMPDETLGIFENKGKVASTLTQDIEKAGETFSALEHAGINMKEVGEILQQEGVQKFKDSFVDLLAFLG
ncbi:MAG: transaldolase [Proteobacteria bacterium]|nr:transaldolase [Pseudomonadota bacterium]MDE3209018.1 transaldolase [Pseudomonadota bacterium]